METAGAIQTLPVPKAASTKGTRLDRLLLECGVLSSLAYVAMNAVIPLLWPEYSIADQTVSELSAIGAPTRPIWLLVATVYELLYAAFGVGVWKAAGSDRRLRIAGALIMAQAIVSLFWPPMHLRGAEFTGTDTMHIVFAMVTVLLMLLTITAGAAALGQRFRLYSAATVLVFVVFGTLTGLGAPSIGKNLPTPLIGVWERINIGAFMAWVVVLAYAISVRRQAASDVTHQHVGR